MPLERPAAPTPRTMLAMAATAALTAAAWLGFLAWDNQTHVSNGIETGPYEPWQVWSVVAALAVLLVAALLLGLDPWRTSLTISATIATCMFVSFTALAPPRDDASLWPIGVALTFLGTATGCAVVWVIVDVVRPARRP